ncbi:MAG: CrcB family protein [Planctomycetota bacterium]
MKLFLDLFAIGIAASFGALVRYGFAQAFAESKFPMGTFIANMTGCLLIGVLVGSSDSWLSPRMKLAAGVGFLGSLTTFSTFAAETVQAAQKQAMPTAIGSVGANVIAGVTLVMIGIWLGKTVAGK